MSLTIRDLRESKNLSQDKVADACGLTYSKFCRVEGGSSKTTPEEVQAVLDVLGGMEPSTRKMVGRPFKDPAKQAAVQAARDAGESVAAALSSSAPAPVVEAAPGVEAEAEVKPKPKRAPRAKNDIAAALAQKSPARVRRPKKVV